MAERRSIVALQTGQRRHYWEPFVFPSASHSTGSSSDDLLKVAAVLLSACIVVHSSQPEFGTRGSGAGARLRACRNSQTWYDLKEHQVYLIGFHGIFCVIN